MKVSRNQLRKIIESVVKQPNQKIAHQAMESFNLPDDHPIGEVKEGILVLHQGVQTTVENAELFAKETAKDMGYLQQFFSASKYFHPDPFEAKDIFFKMRV